MSRWLPQPIVSLGLLITWLLLFNAVTPGLLLLGIILAITIPLFTAQFWPSYPRTVRLAPLLKLLGVVVYDIIVANLKVALLILGPARHWRPHFVVIPVELREPVSLTLLASIISLTPGTVSANLSADRRSLLVHDLDVEDPEVSIRRIKERYERPLREIFE